MEKLSKMKDYELLGKKVYRILKSKIVNGSFKPGSKLSETKIANQMEISRTPVREAMRELSARGFVNMIPNQGIIVKSDSIEDIQKVMQIRGVLEGLAARLATPLITEGKIKILEACNEKMEKFISKNNVLAFGKESEKFHKVILEVCGNDLLVQIRKNLDQKTGAFKICKKEGGINRMYIELSYPINKEMPRYPGSPKLEIIPVTRMSQNNHSNTTVIKIYTHGGTHVDAPFHFYDKGKTIEQIPIEDFVYEHPLIIQKESKKSQLIEVEDLKQYNQKLYTADILFFYTGYCKLRNKPELYVDDFPSISEETAKFIRTELLNIKAIAIDTSSIESATLAPKTGRIVHKTLLDGDLYHTRPLLIYEDVNIGEILDKDIKRIYAFPLRLTGLDASPVNMVAEV